MLNNCKLSPNKDQRWSFVLDTQKLIKVSLTAVSRQEDITLHCKRKVVTCLLIWPTLWAGKMNQILHCDWLPERTILPARNYALSCEKILWKFPLRFIKIYIRSLCREKYFPRRLHISCICIGGIWKRRKLKESLRMKKRHVDEFHEFAPKKGKHKMR